MSDAAGELACRPFRSVLIANRGEIAVRVIAACREAGLRSIAVYSDADRHALHVARADEAHHIGPPPARDSYLNIAAILDAARRSGAEAIHPGYGFLSENATFARAVLDAGLVWIGPPPRAIAAMGDKVAAKRLLADAGVPLVPGYDGEEGGGDGAELLDRAEAIGFPVLIKAAAGGGGRGMRVVERAADFAGALAGARREAGAAFGDDRVFLEKYLRDPRHIEVQVFADAYGNVVHLGERECSIQRRHQKIVEEAPSPAVDADLRARLGAAAVAAARAVDYVGAGTVEFLLDADGQFFFLEMNTRLQVEHPVTELVTGRDLVHLQLTVAAGEPLPFNQDAQDAVALRGHAIECRVYAEDAAAGFLPSSGPIRLFAPPEGPGIRNDVGVATGDEVGVHYDPQLAKLIVHAPDRATAIARLTRALRDYAVLGPTTNLPYLLRIAEHPVFRAGDTSTGFVSLLPPLPAPDQLPREVLLGAAALDILDREERARLAGRPANPWRVLGAWQAGGGGGTTLRLRHGEVDLLLTTERGDEGAWHVALAGERATIRVERRPRGEVLIREGARSLSLRGVIAPEGYLLAWAGEAYRLVKPAPPTVETTLVAAHDGGHAALTAPMPGKILTLAVAVGDTVSANQPLLVLEAMKMEHTIAAPHAGTVRRLPYPVGAVVASGAVLAEIDE